MTKKFVLILVLSVLTVGVVFSQTDFKGMAKNTVTADVGPTIIGAVIGVAGDMLGGGTGLSSSGFGIGAQYERQLARKFSVAARFAYLAGGVGMSDSSDQGGTNINTSLGIDMSSYSIEGHARFYPWGKTFFLDGMLGYANMAVKFSGNMIGTVEVGGVEQKQEVSVNMDASQGFFKMGAKIGWRISFGKNGGFTFEPAFGYSYGIGFGDSVGDQLSKQIKDKSGADIGGGFNQVFDIVQNFIFIGGPRMTLAFGWRF